MTYEQSQLASLALAGFLLLIGIILFIKWQYKRRWPYQVQNAILTPAELAFFKALSTCVAGRAVICPKVGLKDFLAVDRKKAGKHYMKYFGKISQKHVDFLLCDAKTYRPICGIELNDSSHLDKKVMERDKFVNKAYQAAGLPLISITAKRRYDQQELRAALEWLF